MIKCELVKISEHSFISSKKKKYARYSNSCFWDIGGFGRKSWVIVAYIDPEDPLLLTGECDVYGIAEGCISFLNQRPPRKKYAKKDPKPKYGNLKLYSASIVSKRDKKYIAAKIITDERKHKLFWGKGQSV
jgi:hypothetical protein